MFCRRKQGIQRPTWLAPKTERIKPTPAPSVAAAPQTTAVPATTTTTAASSPVVPASSAPTSHSIQHSGSSKSESVKVFVETSDSIAHSRVKDAPRQSEVPSSSRKLDAARVDAALEPRPTPDDPEREKTANSNEIVDGKFDANDEEDEFGDAAMDVASKASAASTGDSKRPATQPTSTANLDSDDEDLFREIDAFL